jgi:hypothetical protein
VFVQIGEEKTMTISGDSTDFLAAFSEKIKPLKSFLNTCGHIPFVSTASGIARVGLGLLCGSACLFGATASALYMGTVGLTSQDARGAAANSFKACLMGAGKSFSWIVRGTIETVAIDAAQKGIEESKDKSLQGRVIKWLH